MVAVDPDADRLAELAAIPDVATLVGDAATEQTNLDAVRLALDMFGRLAASVLNAGAGGAPPIEAPGA